MIRGMTKKKKKKMRRAFGVLTVDEWLALVDGHGLFQGLALSDGLQQLASGLFGVTTLLGSTAERWQSRGRRWRGP